MSVLVIVPVAGMAVSSAVRAVSVSKAGGRMDLKEDKGAAPSNRTSLVRR
jgi:hypothetical protein